LKGFEIIQRVKQIGGDEAKAILVNFNDNPDVLEQDIKIETGGGDRISVIGLSDFKNKEAIQKIVDFISKD